MYLLSKIWLPSPRLSPLVLLVPNTFMLFWLSNLSTSGVSDGVSPGVSDGVSPGGSLSAINLKPTFSLKLTVFS